MTVERRRKIRTVGELAHAMAAKNCRVHIDGKPVDDRTTSEELIEAMNDGRLWAVTYHRLGGTGPQEGEGNGTDQG